MNTYSAMLDLAKSLLVRALAEATPREMSLELTRQALAILQRIAPE